MLKIKYSKDSSKEPVKINSTHVALVPSHAVPITQKHPTQYAHVRAYICEHRNAQYYRHLSMIMYTCARLSMAKTSPHDQ